MKGLRLFILFGSLELTTSESLLETTREEITSVKADNLVDNRDYSVNEVCDSRHQEIATLQSTTSYSHDTLYVSMRHFMLSSLLKLQDATTSKESEALDTLVALFQSDVVEKAGKLAVLEV